MLDDFMREALGAKAASFGVGKARHHVFLCTDATQPKCAPREATLEAWQHLKSRLKERGLEGSVHADPALPCVQRSKADCLRICAAGPIAVVYPDGVWYAGVTPGVIDRIIDEHLLGGRPVQEHVLARDALEGPPSPHGS